MSFFKFNLLLTSILLVIVYFTAIPFYNEWLRTKAWAANNNIFDQMQNLDTTFRNEYRFGATYGLDMDIKRVLSTHKDAVLLLPNNDFMKANNIPGNIDMQEPAVFYYYTGITSVLANSPDVQRANWALLASKKMGLRLMEIKSQGQRDSIITMYKQFLK